MPESSPEARSPQPEAPSAVSVPTALSHGRLVIISGPSGAGKSTLVKRVISECPGPLVCSVSATTRRPRPGEVDGKHYYFLDGDEFTRRRQRGDFLEVFEVFGRGDWYGTLRSEVTPRLADGKWVVLEIDVHGMLALMAEFPDALTIFVRPSSQDELERRLRQRRTETEAAIARRLEEARRELEYAGSYQFQVINDDVDEAVRQICDILNRGAN